MEEGSLTTAADIRERNRRCPARISPRRRRSACRCLLVSRAAAASTGINLYGYVYDTIGNCHWAAENTYTANNLNQYVSILRASQMLAHPSGSATPNLPSEAELLRCISSLREISHDADGNMTSDGVFTYAYDADNRLASVSSNELVLVTNQYDHKGRRVRKTTPTSETTFLYDGWNLIYEREIAGTVTNETYYYWGKDISGSLQGAGGVGGLLYVKHNDAIYVPHADAMGNILRYTDTAGNVVAAYTYDAFGKTISATGTMATVFRHRFSTKYYDKETGLYYYGYRFYLPSLMRWLNRDSIEERGGETLYAFCRNNCIDGIDVLGCLIVRVHRFGEDPPRGWENPQNIGETHTTFRVPSVRPFACAKGKWGFKVTFEPNTTTVDIYYKESVSLDTIKDESEHLKLAREYDEALDVFKAAVEAICDCPAKAKRLYNEANGKLQEARSMYELINGWLESPGGPHGH